MIRNASGKDFKHITFYIDSVEATLKQVTYTLLFK